MNIALKVTKVIKSCETQEQLDNAIRFAKMATPLVSYKQGMLFGHTAFVQALKIMVNRPIFDLTVNPN